MEIMLGVAGIVDHTKTSESAASGIFYPKGHGSLADVFVRKTYHDWILLLNNDILSIAYHLTEEHSIPHPVFQDDNCCLHKVVIEFVRHDEYSEDIKFFFKVP